LQQFQLRCMLLAAHNITAFLAADKWSSPIKQLLEPLTNTALLTDLNKLWTKANLERSGSIHLVSYPLADNLCWVHKIIKDGIVDLWVENINLLQST